jgi:hypothetical protein
MKFKEGDRVICINNTDNNQLVLNKHYTVRKIFTEENRICLLNHDGKGFYNYRFELDKQYYRKEKIKQLRNGF